MKSIPGGKYSLTSNSPDPSNDPVDPHRAKVIRKPIIPQVRPLDGDDPYEATVPAQFVKMELE